MYSALIAFFTFAITLSFLCSLWEAVLLSITPMYAQIKMSEGKIIGKKLQYFKENIDQPLAAILTLNTFAHTIGAIGVGEQAALIWYETNPMITSVVVPLSMTMAILILSEIIPKTIGANFWRELASFTIYSLTFIIKILYPLVWLCQLITKSFRREKDKSIFSRSDFITLTEIGAKQGVFQRSESDLIERALDLSELRVTEVMRPSKDMIMLNRHDSIEKLMQTIRKYRYSRYPVYDVEKTDIIGIIHVKDLLASEARFDPAKGIEPYIRPILKVSYTLPALSLLPKFREGMPHFALVYKGKEHLLGFVTLDNILHVMFGLIKDEFNKTQDDWIKNPDGSITAKGDCTIYSLERALDRDITLLPDEEELTTLTGLIIARLGRLPKINEKIQFTEFEASIKELEGTNIRKIKIIPKITYIEE